MKNNIKQYETINFIKSMQQFIKNHANNIQKLTQQSFDLDLRRSDGKYRNSILQAMNNSDFAQELQCIPNPINRQGVISCYNQGLYRGFIATLLWGGKHKEHYGSFQKIIMNNTKNKIEYNLDGICKLLQANKINKAFNSLLNCGEFNIQYIGESYFTKILYFISFIVPQSSQHMIKPLILDNILQHVRCAFMIEDGLAYQNYYTWNHQTHHLLIHKDNYSANAYIEYCKRMNDAAAMINVAPDKLEEFLFCSCPLLDGIVPRQYVKQYIDANY